MRRTYQYVGPKKIADRTAAAPGGLRVESPMDVSRWIDQTHQDLDAGDMVTATFVIDEAGWLRIADRRSEHVACACGRPVLSAGEMTFAVTRNDVSICSVTNQSTGYCPEPESWPAVRTAIVRARMTAPDGFSPAFVFRRCPICSSINIVKDGVLECGVCSSSLPEAWNLDTQTVVQ